MTRTGLMLGYVVFCALLTGGIWLATGSWRNALIVAPVVGLIGSRFLR